MNNSTVSNTKTAAENPTRDQDITLIRQLVNDAERFQNDPDKFAQLLSENVHLVNVAGFRVTGKDNIHKMMSKAVQTALSDIITKHELLDIDFLKEDAAIVNCIKRIYVRNGQTNSEKSVAALTFVVTKNDGHWLISSAQNTPIQNHAIRNIQKQNIRSAETHLNSLGGA